MCPDLGGLRRQAEKRLSNVGIRLFCRVYRLYADRFPRCR
jgi:hypothetical protein